VHRRLDARRLRCLRAAAGTHALASWSRTPRPGPACRRPPRIEIRASLAATSLLESAAYGPPAPPGNRRHRDLPPPPSGNHCSSRLDLLPLPRLGSSLGLFLFYREQQVSRNDTRPPTSFARRIPDGKGSWEIFEKKGKQSALVDGRNRNGSDGSGTRGR